MTYYPLNTILAQIEIFPLFGDRLEGEPYLLDLSSENSRVEEYDTGSFDVFQRQVFNEMKSGGYRWGVGRYLEETTAAEPVSANGGRGSVLPRWPGHHRWGT